MLFVCYPRCSTCQRALAWLRDRGHEPEIRDIVGDPPTAEELARWWRASGLARRRIVNTSGQLYRARGLKDRIDEMSDEALLAELDGEGMLVRRPILVTEDGVGFGFREAEWEALLP